MKMKISSILYFFLFLDLINIKCVNVRDLDESKSNDFFLSIDDNTGNGFCTNINNLDYVESPISPINHYIQLSRKNSTYLNDFLQGNSSKTSYMNNIMLFSIPSIFLTIFSIAYMVLNFCYIFICGFCEIREKIILIDSDIFCRQVGFLIISVILFGFTVQGIIEAGGVYRLMHDSECSVALFFDEILNGPNPQYQNNLIASGDGLLVLEPYIEDSLKQIRGNSSAFEDLGTYDFSELDSYNKTLFDYIENFSLFFSSMSVMSPKYRSGDCNVTNNASDKSCFFQIDMSINAEDIQNNLEADLFQFYTRIFKDAKAVLNSFKNLFNEGSVPNITNVFHNQLVPNINNMINSIKFTRSFAYSLIETINSLSKFTGAINCLAFCLSSISLILMIIGYAISEWQKRPIFKKLIFIGSFLTGPSVFLLSFSSIFSMILSMLYTDSCALIQKDNLINFSGFFQDISLKKAINEIIANNKNVYDVLEIGKYFTDFQIIMVEGSYLSSVETLTLLTKFNYPTMKYLFNVLTNIWDGFEDESSVLVQPGSYTIDLMENQTKYCKDQRTQSKYMQDKIVFNPIQCIYSLIDTNFPSDGPKGDQFDIGIRCIPIDYFCFPPPPQNFSTDLGCLMKSIMSTRYANIEQEIRCTSSAGYLIPDGFYPLYKFKVDVHKKFQVANENYLSHCLDIKKIPMPTSGSYNDSIYLNSGEYILRMYSCLFENSRIISEKGVDIGKIIQNYRDLIDSLYSGLITNFNSDYIRESYERMYVITCETYGPTFLLIFIFNFISACGISIVGWLIGSLIRHEKIQQIGEPIKDSKKDE